LTAIRRQQQGAAQPPTIRGLQGDTCSINLNRRYRKIVNLLHPQQGQLVQQMTAQTMVFNDIAHGLVVGVIPHRPVD